jgi:hypothetical protein
LAKSSPVERLDNCLVEPSGRITLMTLDSTEDLLLEADSDIIILLICINDFLDFA